MYSGSLFSVKSELPPLATAKDTQVTVTLTTTNRLLIASPMRRFGPIGFEPESRPQIVRVGSVKEVGLALTGGDPDARIAGPNGLEKAVVVRVSPSQAAPLDVIIAESGATVLTAWSRGS
jgi:hypothetical protein